MKLVPTISLVMDAEEIKNTARSLRRLNPYETEASLQRMFKESAMNGDTLSDIEVPVATILDIGLIVENFAARVDIDFLYAGDRWLILSTGDVINLTADANENARKIFEYLLD